MPKCDILADTYMHIAGWVHPPFTTLVGPGHSAGSDMGFTDSISG